jgi:hypothetical protein
MELPHALSWQSLEHTHGERTADWYWGVGAVAVSIIILCIFFDNYLLGVIIALGAFAAIVHAQKGPELVYHELNHRGVVVGKTFYPYQNLRSFWIDFMAHRPRLVIRPKKQFAPLLVMFLDDIDDEIIRDHLARHLPEIEFTESLAKKMLERVGF